MQFQPTWHYKNEILKHKRKIKFAQRSFETELMQAIWPYRNFIRVKVITLRSMRETILQIFYLTSENFCSPKLIDDAKTKSDS